MDATKVRDDIIIVDGNADKDSAELGLATESGNSEHDYGLGIGLSDITQGVTPPLWDIQAQAST